MRDLYLALSLLVVGFVALGLRATREPFDYRSELAATRGSHSDLEKALGAALEEKIRRDREASRPQKQDRKLNSNSRAK